MARRTSAATEPVAVVQTLAQELLGNAEVCDRLAESPDPAATLYRLAQFGFFRLLSSRDALEGRAFDTLAVDLRHDEGLPQGVFSHIPLPPSVGDPSDCYQALLSLQPRLDLRRRAFALVRAIGSPRKTSGSYYTPACLIERVLRSA